MLWNSDAASLMSRAKPIRTLEDLKGMKIRTPSAAQSAQLEALGAIPIDMPANQIYNNLDRGVIDASMIPMSAALDFKLIEVAKYFTVDAPLGRSPFLVAMNRARYEKLPANLKKVIDDTTGLKLSLKGADTYDKKNDEALAEAKKTREVISLSRAGTEALGEALQADDPAARSAAGEKAGLPARGPGRRLRAAELNSSGRIDHGGWTWKERGPRRKLRRDCSDACLRVMALAGGWVLVALDGLHRPRRRSPLRLQPAVQRLARGHRIRDVGDRVSRHRLLRLGRRACRRRHSRAAARGSAAALRARPPDVHQRASCSRRSPG